jgi:hypothetical protein
MGDCWLNANGATLQFHDVKSLKAIFAGRNVQQQLAPRP